MLPKKMISASILSADFSRLGEEINLAVKAGVDYIHFDVMDHHFVPNLSFGAPICKSLRKAGITVPIDVHLMVDNPEDFIKPFAEAGANLLTFHPETVDDVDQVLSSIKKSGMKTGLAFNPDCPVKIPAETLQSVDLILLMSVYPGFAGQSFITDTLQKIQQTRVLIDQTQTTTMLGIDGGIKANNIHTVSQAGADFFVVGSGLFHASDYEKEMQRIRQSL